MSSFSPVRFFLDNQASATYHQNIMKLKDLSRDELLLIIDELNLELKKCNSLNDKLNKTKTEIAEPKPSESAFNESELAYRNLYKNTPVMMHSIDSQGRLLSVSNYWLQTMGYSEDEVLGEKSIDFLTEASKKYAVETAMPAFFKKGECSNVPYQFQKKNGEIIDTLLSAITLKDPSNGVVGSLAVIIDVTEQKQIEEQLKKSENSFRFLAENAKDMIYHMSIPDASYEYVSSASLEIFGYTADEFYNTPLLIEKVIHPDWIEYFKNEWNNLLAGRVPPFYEYQIIHKSGEVRWLNQNNTLILDKQGKPAAIEGIVRDITNRKLAEKEIIKIKETAERYLNMAGSMFVSIDFNGDIILVNQKGLEILEYENSNELIGKNWFDTCIPIEIKSEIKAVLGEVIKGKLENVEHYENYVITKTGNLKKISWYNSFIKDDFGQIQCILSSGNDISKRELAENKLKKSLEEKEVLLRELYHRTKNNMQVISSMLGIRAMSLGNSQLTDIFKDIENKILSMALVHKKLCESADLSHISLKEYLEELIQQLEQSLFSSSRKIEILIKCVNTQVLFDIAVPLGLVINEIVTNAIKHAFPDNRDGRIDINLNITSNEEIILEIMDNGIGIPKDFDLKNDAGFGLHTVQKLVESQLGGSITLKSQNGLHCRIMIQSNFYDSRI